MNTSRITWVVSLFLIFGIAQTAAAWEQGAHRQINYEAVQLFLSQMEEKEKYQLGPITKELRGEPYRGIAVSSSGLFIKNYQIEPGSYTMPQWIILGGDWADEPHLHASVRHFYDPLVLVRRYLTDQWQFHGVLYESPGIDAMTWGLDHSDNPFSFMQGLTYYKLAMEVAEDIPLAPMLLQKHFKLNLNLAPVDHADQRRTYLALAYRALGETMHMLGDMTQPAHVRNDSHPLDEPIETRVFSEHVRHAAQDKLLDPRITPYLASAGGALQRPERLFIEVAAFINKHFYSTDTIYDEPSKIIPNNYDLLLALPYPSPQFSDLWERSTMVQGYLIQRRVKRYEGQGGAFNWTTVPMAQERLSFHWFDPDQSIWIDPKEVAGRYLGKLGRYHIPTAYAPKQARVLMPIAIYSNADLMDLFFPTMELKAAVTNKGIQQGEAPGKNDYSRYVIDVDAEMVHHQQRDPAWSEYGLLIEYTGPATLIFSENDEPIRKRELHFRKGKIDKIEMPDGTLSQRDLELYAPLGAKTLIEEEAFYLIEDNQSVHLEIKAGTRHFQTEPWLFEAKEPTVTILPPRIMTYEMVQGATEVTHDFAAVGRPDDVYRFEWDFGDGATHIETRQPGERSQVSHAYTGLKAGDEFRPTVRLLDIDGNLLAEDGIYIRVSDSDSDADYADYSETLANSRFPEYRLTYTISGSSIRERTVVLAANAGDMLGQMMGDIVNLSGTVREGDTITLRVFVTIPESIPTGSEFIPTRAVTGGRLRASISQYLGYDPVARVEEFARDEVSDLDIPPGGERQFTVSLKVAEPVRATIDVRASSEMNIKDSRVGGAFTINAKFDVIPANENP